MVIYTCGQKEKYGSLPGPLAHPCGKAMNALSEAGYEYETKVVPGYKFLFWTRTGGARDEVKKLSGQEDVPVLVLDSGEVISGSGKIAAWAQEHPAS